eukprot:c6651_g1_i2.p1 GENE.c6651_g1_i2~~c6651_g1_i2.p1  ORF type:complete len:158 (+),score=36.12 c6651_g1_i2:39-512(+)
MFVYIRYFHSPHLTSAEKEQIIANLANFAYDPINYEHFRRLNILDLFLDHITPDQSNDKIAKFAVAGLCNCMCDPANQQYILENDGLAVLLVCLTHSNEDVITYVITTLIYLNSEQSRQVLSQQNILDRMRYLRTLPSNRLQNITQIFMDTYKLQQS